MNKLLVVIIIYFLVYYTIMVLSVTVFLKKTIWRSKISLKDGFFFLDYILRKILTIDNVRKFFLDYIFRKILTIDNVRKCRFTLVDWYCTFKNSDKTMDHLLLHYEFAKVSRNYFFSKVGLEWVMPGMAVKLLASWRGIKSIPHIVVL